LSSTISCSPTATTSGCACRSRVAAGRSHSASRHLGSAGDRGQGGQNDSEDGRSEMGGNLSEVAAKLHH
jgi:hypothetical protein